MSVYGKLLWNMRNKFVIERMSSNRIVSLKSVYIIL